MTSREGPATDAGNTGFQFSDNLRASFVHSIGIAGQVRLKTKTLCIEDGWYQQKKYLRGNVENESYDCQLRLLDGAASTTGIRFSFWRPEVGGQRAGFR